MSASKSVSGSSSAPFSSRTRNSAVRGSSSTVYSTSEGSV